jgi:branched-chain amino acid transport system substrate-binding protein
MLVQAQASGAKVIGLAEAGNDLINVIKQSAEFGITQRGQKLAAFVMFIEDVHGLGLNSAQGLQLATSITGIGTTAVAPSPSEFGRRWAISRRI